MAGLGPSRGEPAGQQMDLEDEMWETEPNDVSQCVYGRERLALCWKADPGARGCEEMGNMGVNIANTGW